MADPKATPPDTPVGEQIFRAPVLPDSRARIPAGAVQTALGWSVPLACASCGKSGGLVPEENCTFAFWLCNTCHETYGDLVNFYVMPDEVFWETIKQEQLATFGRELSITELETVVAADASPLATLLTSGRAGG